MFLPWSENEPSYQTLWTLAKEEAARVPWNRWNPCTQRTKVLPCPPLPRWTSWSNLSAGPILILEKYRMSFRLLHFHQDNLTPTCWCVRHGRLAILPLKLNSNYCSSRGRNQHFNCFNNTNQQLSRSSNSFKKKLPYRPAIGYTLLSNQCSIANLKRNYKKFHPLASLRPPMWTISRIVWFRIVL